MPKAFDRIGRPQRPRFLTTKEKVDPKTAQTALRQSNAAFTFSRYTQTDSDELMAAQQMMVDAIFGAAGNAVQHALGNSWVKWSGAWRGKSI